MNHTHTSSARIERHLDPGRRWIYVKTDGGTNPQLSISLIDDADRCLAMTEVGDDCFQSEQESLVKLGCGQHLRRSLDENIVLTQVRGNPFRIRKGGRGLKT